MSEQDIENKSVKKELFGLWQERFRPTKVKQVILSSKNRNYIDKIVEGDLPHLIIYYSKPGNGKTSLAKAICNDKEIEDVLYLNASKDGNVDTVRSTFMDFVSVRSVDGGIKVVICDEMEASSKAFQEALKVFIEEYTTSCRFILITNNINKIIEPLHSRCTPINFEFENKEVKEELVPQIKNRILAILNKLNIEYSDKVIDNLIEKCYPDIRSMFKFLQKEYEENGVITSSLLKNVVTDTEFYDFILNKKLTDARKYIIENSLNYSDMYGKLFREFIPLIKESTKQGLIIIKLDQYMNRGITTPDPELTFTACLLEIMIILNK